MKSEKIINNQGYSLVELIVTILVSSMVMTMVMIFISISTKSYDRINKDTVLQTEAQMATSYIGDIAIEAKKCEITSFLDGGYQYQVLSIKAPDAEYVSGTKYDYYYIILYEIDKKTLRFCKVKDDAILKADGTYELPSDSELVFTAGTNDIDYKTMLGAGHKNVIGNKRALLAQYVSNMNVTIPDITTGERLVQLQLTFTYRDSVYTTTKNIASRNL